MTFVIHREEYAKTGGMSSKGISKLLGCPDNDRLVTLVREAFQNSWDARLGGNRKVKMQIIGLLPDESRHAFLKSEVLVDPPKESEVARVLKDPANSGMLLIVDRGTKGLSGPYMMGDATEETEKPHFIDFVWVWGGRHDTVEGGTYGYGKAALYNASSCRTILVHTKCEWRGKLQERLIVCGINVDERSRKYTGRLWWGRETDGGDFGPYVNRDAARIAERLGFPAFGEDETGTTIAILAPGGVEDLDLANEVRRLGRDASQWFWSRIDQKKLSVHCDCADEHWEVSVDEWPLPAYRRALTAILAVRSGDKAPKDVVVEEIWCRKPPVLLGHLALTRCLSAAIKPPDLSHTEADDEDLSASAAGIRAESVALMRRPQMVVQYRRARAAATQGITWAGAFLTTDNDDIERVFAAAEPPAHDNWITSQVPEKANRRLVNMALKRVDEAILQFLAPTDQTAIRPDETPHALLARDLAGIIAGVADGQGSGPGKPAPPRGGGGGALPRAGLHVSSKGRPLVKGDGSVIVITFTYDLRGRIPEGEEWRLEAKIGVILDGSDLETEAPAGESRPEFKHWIDPKGTTHLEPRPIAGAGEWRLVVSSREQVVVGAVVSAKAVHQPEA